MKKLIFYSFSALVVISLFVSSCTKEITNPTVYLYRDTVIKDTVKIFSRDTVILGMDSVRLDFVYTVSYSIDSTYVVLHAADASQNVPINAEYTWVLDGNGFTEKNKTYFNLSFDKKDNGNHLLSMSVNLPTQKKVYSIVKSFTINKK